MKKNVLKSIKKIIRKKLNHAKLKDVAAAQREIVDTMRELDEQGVISLSGGGDGEDGYVS